MEATVGVNHRRFNSVNACSSDFSKYACDISYVSHASKPARQLVDDFCRTQSPLLGRLLDDVLDALSAVYSSGSYLTTGSQLLKLLQTSCVNSRVSLDTPSMDMVLDFVSSKLNNALFRHQTLYWAADLGVNLRLYGNGWENHPTLSKFARGPAANADVLPLIYRASKINLQVIPTGAAHQRTYEALCAGGFVLPRQSTGDVSEPIVQQILLRCRQLNITDRQGLSNSFDKTLRDLCEQIVSLGSPHPLDHFHDYVDHMVSAESTGWARVASTLFDQYPEIYFNSQQQLKDRVEHFLTNDPHRQQIVESMRVRVIDTVTYDAITKRLLAMIEQDLSDSALTKPMEAA